MKGSRLKQLREEKGMLQEELARALSVSPSAIGMYERDYREPSDELLLQIARFFDVSIDYLLGNSDVRNYNENKDPFGLEQLGFNIKDYVPPTPKQKEQIKEIIETILKDNKKDKSQ